MFSQYKLFAKIRITISVSATRALLQSFYTITFAAMMVRGWATVPDLTTAEPADFLKRSVGQRIARPFSQLGFFSFSLFYG